MGISTLQFAVTGKYFFGYFYKNANMQRRREFRRHGDVKMLPLTDARRLKEMVHHHIALFSSSLMYRTVGSYGHGTIYCQRWNIELSVGNYRRR